MVSIEVFVILAVGTLDLAIVPWRVGTNELMADASLFETRLEQAGIRHKLIRPYTPRHNGKVERSHRKDNEYFYADHKFYSSEDFKAQLKIHRYKYNRFPIRPLGWLSPNEYLAKYRNLSSV